MANFAVLVNGVNQPIIIEADSFDLVGKDEKAYRFAKAGNPKIAEFPLGSIIGIIEQTVAQAPAAPAAK